MPTQARKTMKCRESDPEPRLYYYRARYYDPQAGRFLGEDPMAFDAGVNFYSYAVNSPLDFRDPGGMDIAVIENGPTEGNPIGHTAIAITGHGVYSFGNDTPCGSSLHKYLQREAPRRNTVVWIIKTTASQDAAALADLQKEGNCQRKLPLTFGNCSFISNGALSAAGIPDLPQFTFTGDPVPPSTPVPGTAGLRAALAGASSVSIPKNSPTIPGGLQGFEPH
jgi:RHS repeat-associated protein